MRKAFILLLTLGIVAMIVVLVVSGTGDSREAVVIAENQIYLEDVKLSRTEAGGDSYTVITAASAYFDRNSNRVQLNNTELEYIGGGNRLTSRADQGQYVFDERLVTRGHISGIWNDTAYRLGDNGTFAYDFPTGDGAFRDNVTLDRGGGTTIRADEVTFNAGAQYVLFLGNVSMFYTGDTIP